MSILIYTFRTFPWIDQLPNPFVFNAIRHDVLAFAELIHNINPYLIIGVAKSTLKYSTLESYAVNKFNHGIIDKSGLAQYQLDLLPELNFQVRLPTTTSFCNYAAYKVAQLIQDKGIQHGLIHTTSDDLIQIIKLVSQY